MERSCSTSAPAAAVSCDPPSGGGPSKRVAIIGGGVAGVCTAWLLDGAYAVTLFESEAQLGGNVETVPFTVRGQQVLVDIGAQYFHPGLYPNYARLLDLLAIRDPQDAAKSDLYPAPSTITIFDPAEANPRFVSPVLPDRVWPLSADWNGDGVAAFAKLPDAAKALDAAGDWLTPLDSWLQTIGMNDNQRNNLLVPWAGSLFSGDIEQSRGLSALGTAVFVARTVGANPTDAIYYQTLKHGLGQVPTKLVSQCTTLTVQTSTPVQAISRACGTQWQVQTAAGAQGPFDAVILALPAYAAAKLVAGIDELAAQKTALETVEWYDSHLAIHTDPTYAPADPANVSFLNCRIQGGTCEASMNLSISVAPPPDGQPTGLWKSWTTLRNVQPANILHTVQYKHYLPTPKSYGGNAALAKLQGQAQVWFAGGWTKPFDTQETALLSALDVAKGLAATASVHSAAFAAAT